MKQTFVMNSYSCWQLENECSLDFLVDEICYFERFEKRPKMTQIYMKEKPFATSSGRICDDALHHKKALLFIAL